jgi:tetratricopeptide (TPR) repeat protein
MRSFWRWLPPLLLLGAAAWLAVPHLAAWYHWRAAQAAMDRYHSAEALDHLHACLNTWPESLPARLLACRAARRLESFTEAQEHLQECQRLEDPPSPAFELVMALLAAARGDLDSAEPYLEAWLMTHPAEAPLAWEALAAGYLRVYRIPHALRCLDMWLRRVPDDPQAFFLRANVAKQLGSGRRALPDYRRVVDLDPDRVDARRLLALCLLEVGQFDEAAAHLDRVLRDKPDDPELLTSMARCQGKLGRLAAAQQTLDRVLVRHPSYGLALRTYGELALWRKRPAEAEKWLRRAVGALPHDYETHFALTQALQRAGQTAEAHAQAKITENLKSRLERLDEIKRKQMPERPSDPAVHSELGRLLLSLGYQDVGRDWLQSAIRLDPGQRAAHEALADYYAAKGNEERAAYHRQEARTPKASGAAEK